MFQDIQPIVGLFLAAVIFVVCYLIYMANTYEFDLQENSYDGPAEIIGLPEDIEEAVYGKPEGSIDIVYEDDLGETKIKTWHDQKIINLS